MKYDAIKLSLELDLAKKALPRLLEDRNTWHTKAANASYPEIHRLWRPFGEDMCVHLHRLIRDEAGVFHTHVHPLIVEIVSGEYIMSMKSSPTSKVVMTQYMKEGSKYTITSPEALHAIQLVTPNVWSIMVTGPIFDEKNPIRPARELTDGERDRVYNFFKKRFGGK